MPLLSITPQKMTSMHMELLEEKGLIVRLMPSRSRHRVEVEKEKGLGEYIYNSSNLSGTHSLMAVAIDNKECYNFGTHLDNEEFLLLGGIEEKKLYLLIALMHKDELEKKITDNTLTADDFLCLDVVFNDPELSFFIMKKGVPHGECSGGAGRPATFYVTEGSRLGLERTDFSNYNLKITEVE